MEDPASSSAAAPAKPIPYPEGPTVGFWEAAREHRLSFQYCPACALFIHPPGLACPRCSSEELEFRQVSGRGRLYSYTIVRDAPARAFESMLPYVVGVVEIEEQPRLMLVTNIIETAPQRVYIGQPLEVVFEDVAPDCSLPQFRPMRA